MTRALLIFVCLLGLLGLGTILIVEKYSNERILPRSFHGYSLAEVKRSWARGERAVKTLWRDWTGKTDTRAVQQEPVTTPVPSASSSEPQIIKWQDERGVWHYEYASPATSAAPTPPP